MGYKSKVKILMKEKDYEKLVELSYSPEAPDALERLITIDCKLEDHNTDSFIPDGWVVLTYNNIMWNKKFKEINFMEPKNLKDNYGIDIDFVRFGELIDDIEFVENIDPSSKKTIKFYVDRSVCLSADLSEFIK